MDVNKKCVQFDNTKGTFVTQTKISDGAFLGKSLAAFPATYFCKNTSS